jgi:hypothetical protein
MSVEWSYFDKFSEITDKYLPSEGEGETKATQIVAAICKLIYKYYNDGDIFDNTYELANYGNDLSSYANWLDIYTDEAGVILDQIKTFELDCESCYEDLLQDLADTMLNEKYLAYMHKIPKVNSIYACSGRFKYDDGLNEEDEDYFEDDEDYEEEY